jgi:hypothetical protein
MGRRPPYTHGIVDVTHKELFMTRPRTFSIAAVLLFVLSLIAAALEVPNLMLGTAASSQFASGGGPPFPLVLLNFAIAILGLVAAYGVWQMQKWGVILAIVLSALQILTALPAILFAPPPFKILGGVAVIWAAAIIVLLLRPQAKSSPTVAPSR